MNGFVLLMSFLSNATNIVLNYLFIIQWDWASAGAGLATAVGQYLALLVGLILACFNIQWQEIPAVAQKILDWSALKATFTFNGNLMIRTLVLISNVLGIDFSALNQPTKLMKKFCFNSCMAV
jgi:MATE family multidrug resistance protein